jgi:transcriptional regulator with XRE-family HTH domain
MILFESRYLYWETNMPTKMLPSRQHIAQVVRTLRRERAWTQAELAKKLDISQGSLSQIESSRGSFSAEQLLLILKLFNVAPDRFADDLPDRGAQLQNNLARLGARHLYESDDVVPSVSVDAVNEVVGETLAEGDPRLVAALAPVLVSNIDRLPLPKLQLDLSRAGLERRVPWLCENVAQAIDSERKTAPPRPWVAQARRAALVIGVFLDAMKPPSQQLPFAWDPLDVAIRDMKTVIEVKEAASEISRKWHIITTLTPEDFARALRDARASHP